MSRFLTMSEENQFSFVCPIFNAETKMSACIKLRNLKYMGRAPDKRAGCKVAMTCGKCPVTTIVDRIGYAKSNEVPDDYGSAVPVVGKLRADLLEAILPVMFIQAHMDYSNISPAERALMETANTRIIEQLKTAPKGTGKYVNMRSMNTEAHVVKPKKPRAEKPKPVAANDALANAARTGDLSAAING